MAKGKHHLPSTLCSILHATPQCILPLAFGDFEQTPGVQEHTSSDNRRYSVIHSHLRYTVIFSRSFFWRKKEQENKKEWKNKKDHLPPDRRGQHNSTGSLQAPVPEFNHEWHDSRAQSLLPPLPSSLIYLHGISHSWLHTTTKAAVTYGADNGKLALELRNGLIEDDVMCISTVETDGCKRCCLPCQKDEANIVPWENQIKSHDQQQVMQGLP